MAKKPTIMELKERIDMNTRQINFISRMMDSVGVAFSNYIKFKEDEEDFKNYLENSDKLHKLTNEEENDRKKGLNKETGDVPTKEVRKAKDGGK